MESKANARDILLSTYSDTFKDVHGFRPRGILFPSHLSDEELEKELSDLEALVQVQIDEDQYEEEQTFYQRVYE